MCGGGVGVCVHVCGCGCVGVCGCGCAWLWVLGERRYEHKIKLKNSHIPSQIDKFMDFMWQIKISESKSSSVADDRLYKRHAAIGDYIIPSLRDGAY